MAQRAVSQQELFAFIHEREFRTAALMLKTFPDEFFEAPLTPLGRSAREASLALIRNEYLLQDVIGTASGWPNPTPVSREDILDTYEAAHRATRSALPRLSEELWNEPLCVAELGLMEPVLRSDLLWIALEDLIDQVEQLATNLRALEPIPASLSLMIQGLELSA